MVLGVRAHVHLALLGIMGAGILPAHPHRQATTVQEAFIGHRNALRVPILTPMDLRPVPHARTGRFRALALPNAPTVLLAKFLTPLTLHVFPVLQVRMG